MNGRNSQRRRIGKDTDRDGGRFVALPLTVLESAAYAALSHTARSLLLEVALQYCGDNNGRLLLSRAHLASRGWKSADVIQRAKQELLDGGFIFETVKGHRPNKASWYALTWYRLHKHPGYDPGAERAFERSAYRQRGVAKNAPLIPSPGAAVLQTGPPDGTGALRTVPSRGAMRVVQAGFPVPPTGHPLEKPSAGCNDRAAVGPSHPFKESTMKT